MIRGMKTINHDDLNTSFIQDNAKKAIDQLQGKDIIDGLLLKNISLVSGTDKIIQHGLGRQWLGWIPVRKSATCDIFESSTINSALQSTIILRASANVTISLWVF